MALKFLYGLDGKMTETQKILQEVFEDFGFFPASIGLKHRDWYFAKYLSKTEVKNGVKKGFLCVRAEDTFADHKATAKLNFVWQEVESPAEMLRYYYFRPLLELDRLEIDTSFEITKKSLPKTIFDVRRRLARS